MFVVSRRGALLVVEDGDEEDEEVDEGVVLLFFEEEEEAAAAEGVVFLSFDEEDEEDVAAGIASLLSEGPDENDEAGGVVVDVDEDAIARASIKAWRYSGELSSMVLRLATRDSSHFRDNSSDGDTWAVFFGDDVVSSGDSEVARRRGRIVRSLM